MVVERFEVFPLNTVNVKVSALCSGFPMPSWYSATLPRRDLASDNQPQFLQSPAVCCRVAPDLIFQIRPGPDLAGFGIADPAGPGLGL